MLYDKATILGVLGQQADRARVDQAVNELPDVIDTERHAELLTGYGLDPERLPEQLKDATHGEAGARTSPPGFEAGPG